MLEATEIGYWKTFFPAASVLGLGMAITVSPLTTTVMGSVSQEQSGAASGINNAVARLAGLLAIALLGLAMQSAFDAQLNQHLGAARLPAPLQATVQQQRGKLAAMEIPSSVENGFRMQVQHIVDESFVAAFRCVLLSCAALAVISGLAPALTISYGQVPCKVTVTESSFKARLVTASQTATRVLRPLPFCQRLNSRRTA